ncbi:response regulator transcription factor [Hamadaea sp. NPDC050747]|uniref:response regulator transcription factor n=1 Tax=Hamadaea sp. NPDC050747 TaxID=3155789 RepID=UPI003406CAD9
MQRPQGVIGTIIGSSPARTRPSALAGHHGVVNSEPAPAILVIEDDARLASMLDELLTDEGYAVEVAVDGQRGLHLGLTRTYQVVILDRGLPALDGLDLLARLRRTGVTCPVLVLSALGNPADRVEGLDAGAEDYLAKPFDIDELLARLRALRRRHLDRARIVPIGSRRLNLDTREVSAVPPDAPVRLSDRESSLLAYLATRPARVFSRAELRAAVFIDAGSDVAVDTYVHYLRRKLGPDVIATVRGRGYRLGHA